MKSGKNTIFIIIGIVCFLAVAVLAFFILTDSNPVEKDKIDPDKTVAWEDYIERYNMYAAQNDLHLMSKDIETGDSYVRGEFNGLRGEFWIEDGYMDSVSVDALNYDQVEPYLYGLLKSFDPNVDRQEIDNLLAGLDVKSDGYSEYFEGENLSSLENFSANVRKDGGLYDISVYARYRDY